MKLDFISVQIQTINGINNPMLTIKGTTKCEDYSFEVYADGQKISFLFAQRKDNHYLLKAELNNKIKNVETFIIYENQRYKISSLSNSKIKRILRKIKAKIKSSIMTIKGRFRPIQFYNPKKDKEYQEWLNKQKKEKYKSLSKKKKLSIIVVNQTNNLDRIKKSITSLQNQNCTNYELFIINTIDNKTVKRYFEQLNLTVENVKPNELSLAINKLSKGINTKSILFTNTNAVFVTEAVYEFLSLKHKDKTIAYSDHDILTDEGMRIKPQLKPDFCPDTFLGSDYIGDTILVEKDILEKLNYFQEKINDDYIYEFVLRASEQFKINHFPRIVYSKFEEKIDKKTSTIRKQIIKEALIRRNRKANVTKIPFETPLFKIDYLLTTNPKISIIIPTKDGHDILEACINSIYKKTTYDNFEIIVINNNSEKPETFKLFETYQEKYQNFKVIDAPIEFNYSKLNNLAAKEATGEHILLLNNDTKVITKDWLEKMVSYSMQPNIGAVGAKLLYPDNTIQHAGVIGVKTVTHSFVGYTKDQCKTEERLMIPSNYMAVTAACLMVKKSAYDQVGGLEEQLKVAYNDVDFCLKLLDNGYNNIILPDVELYHYESKSRGKDINKEKVRRLENENVFLKEKWDDIIFHDPCYNENLSKFEEFYLER